MFLKNIFNKSLALGFTSIFLLISAGVISYVVKFHITKSLLTTLLGMIPGLFFLIGAIAGIYGFILALKIIKTNTLRAFLCIFINSLTPVYFIFSVVVVFQNVFKGA